jgi:hypothetical protein
MPSNRSFPLAGFRKPLLHLALTRFCRNRSRAISRILRRQVVCIALICSLLFLPGSSTAFAQAPVLATSIARLAVLPFTPISAFIRKLFARSVRAQETSVDRTRRVSTVQVNPQKTVGYLGQHLSFSAVGLDTSGKLAHGAKFEWSSSDTGKLRIDETGQATFVGSGLVWITARTQFGVSSRAPVLIRPRTRPAQTDDEWQADQDDLKPDGTTSATPGGVGSLFDRLIDGLAPTALAQSGGGDSGDLPYDELWSEPRNLVGSPRNRVMDASAVGAVLPEGSNFEFSIPIEGLPGRGLPLGVSMNYNSRIWSRHSSAVTFNAVNSWPYIGFSLSFGRIVTYASGSNTKFVLIDSSGTRHYLGSGPGGTTTTYQTNDGSHITYVGTSTSGGTLYYNNGVTMTVNVTNNRLLVDQVKDSNGNYLSISYASQSTPSFLLATAARASCGSKPYRVSRIRWAAL